MLMAKSLHIIFVVCWFAGLFYLGRLFVYFSAISDSNSDTDVVLKRQYLQMMRRVYYFIIIPSSVLSVFLGFYLAGLMRVMSQDWLHTKLLFVSTLIGYQLLCGFFRKKMQKGVALNVSAQFFRMFNEVPAVILFAVVFGVVFKTSVAAYWSSLTIGGMLGVFFMVSIYRKRVKKK